MVHFLHTLGTLNILHTRSIFKLFQFKITSPFDAQQLCSLTELNKLYKPTIIHAGPRGRAV